MLIMFEFDTTATRTVVADDARCPVADLARPLLALTARAASPAAAVSATTPSGATVRRRAPDLALRLSDTFVCLLVQNAL
jgi:hypothetical protein